MRSIWTWLVLLGYCISVLTHYDWHQHPEWTDGEMLCNGFIVLAIVLGLNLPRESK